MYVMHAMLAPAQYRKDLINLDKFIKKHNYHEVKKILAAKAKRLDGKDALDKVVTALDESEKYEKEQEKIFNKPRLIATFSALFCTTISIGIIFFDRKNIFHQFGLTSNVCHYGAGAFGMLGLKFAMDIIFNTPAKRKFEKASTVYAIFARHRKDWEIKYQTTPNIPVQKDP